MCVLSNIHSQRPRIVSVSQTGYMNISIFVRGRVDTMRWIVCASEAAQRASLKSMVCLASSLLSDYSFVSYSYKNVCFFFSLRLNQGGRFCLALLIFHLGRPVYLSLREREREREKQESLPSLCTHFTVVCAASQCYIFNIWANSLAFFGKILTLEFIQKQIKRSWKYWVCRLHEAALQTSPVNLQTRILTKIPTLIKNL